MVQRCAQGAKPCWALKALVVSTPLARRESAFNLEAGLARPTQLMVNNRDLWILKSAVSSTKENVNVYHVESVGSQRSKNDTSACRMFTWLSPVTQAQAQLTFMSWMLKCNIIGEAALLCNQALSGQSVSEHDSYMAFTSDLKEEKISASMWRVRFRVEVSSWFVRYLIHWISQKNKHFHLVTYS